MAVEASLPGVHIPPRSNVIDMDVSEVAGVTGADIAPCARITAHMKNKSFDNTPLRIDI